MLKKFGKASTNGLATVALKACQMLSELMHPNERHSSLRV